MTFVRVSCLERLARLACPGLLVLAVVAACSSTHDTGDTVPARPGAVQPAGGGKLLDEDAACQLLAKAEADARSTLSCSAVKRSCPSYVRPAGGEGCFVYDQTSIEGCDKVYRAFTSCADFDLHPCLISAKSQCSAPTGAGGEGGAAGASSASEAGAGGASGALGDAGAGGA